MARFRVTYRDETPPVEVSVGAFAQIAAKRRYGVAAIRESDPEAVGFAVFVEVVGPKAAAVVEAFDDWLFRVEDVDQIAGAPADDEDPPKAETSSASSPDSPPTSDSTPSES